MTRKIITAFILVLALVGVAFAADADKVVARVNSQDITESELLDFIRPYGQQGMMLYNSEQGRKMILDDVITMRLYALDGEAQKLDEDPQAQAQLATARRAILAQAAMRKIVDGITVSNDEAQNFYAENQKLFVQPERLHARHILVSGDETLAKVQEALKSGKSFDAVAREYSIDPGSAQNGGDLGEFPRGVMVPEFEKAAFELNNPGEVSEPVKTQFGWHIIKLEERIPERTAPFEEVKDRIVQELREQKMQKAVEDRVKVLEGLYKVEKF